MVSTKFLIVVVLGLFAACKSQNMDVLLKDKAYVKQQINCLMDDGPCDMIGITMKRLFPEVLKNGCMKCTPLQIKQAKQIVTFMQNNYPMEYRMIVTHFVRQLARSSKFDDLENSMDDVLDERSVKFDKIIKLRNEIPRDKK